MSKFFSTFKVCYFCKRNFYAILKKYSLNGTGKNFYA